MRAPSPTRAARWRAHAEALREALEEAGWDGEWYRRGYYDDGTPLGAAASSECRIDSIAQSWSVLSGAGEAKRAARAMAEVDARLVRRAERLALLFAPPFDQTSLDPGYVKGYPPGVRENGGQYTHAAIWSVIAFALLGDGDRAAELFSLLNPIHHSATRAGVRRYKVEPYAIAADVYSVAPHVGRGGWTWYTGSAGWMYRAGLEWILGFRVRGAVARARAVRAGELARLRDRVPLPLVALPDLGREPGRQGSWRGACGARREGARRRGAGADPARGRRRDPSGARRSGVAGNGRSGSMGMLPDLLDAAARESGWVVAAAAASL